MKKTVLMSQCSGSLWKLILNQSLSAFAVRGFDVALVWIAVTEVASPASVGLVLFFKFIPYPIFGLLGGWLADLLPRHTIIVVSDLLRGVLLLIAAVIFKRSSDIWTLSIISFLFTTLRTASQPANQGLLPDLVENARLARANSFLHGGMEIAQTLSPVVMAFLMKAVQPWQSLVFLGSVFVCAACLVPRPEVPAVAENRASSTGSVLRSYGRTIVNLRNSRPDVLAAMMIIPVAILGVGGLINFSLPELLIDEQNAQINPYGLVVAALSFGTLPGAYIATTRLGKRLSFSIYAGWLTYGISFYVLSLQTGVAQLVIWATFAGAVGAIADISLTTLLQQGASKSEVSKTFAIFSTLANGSEALSAPMMGLVAAHSSIRYSFEIGSIIVAVSSIFGLLLLYWMETQLDVR